LEYNKKKKKKQKKKKGKRYRRCVCSTAKAADVILFEVSSKTPLEVNEHRIRSSTLNLR